MIFFYVAIKSGRNRVGDLTVVRWSNLAVEECSMFDIVRSGETILHEGIEPSPASVSSRAGSQGKLSVSGTGRSFRADPRRSTLSWFSGSSDLFHLLLRASREITADRTSHGNDTAHIHAMHRCIV